jgi:ankyrin repeat protein
MVQNEFLMDVMAKRGYLDSVKELYFSGEKFSYIAMDRACENGHFSVVLFLNSVCAECTKDAMNYASSNGHLNIVKFLDLFRNEGCTTYSMDWAALNGHLGVFKWLHCNRKEGCTKFALKWAVLNGHFDIVEYMVSNNMCALFDLCIALKIAREKKYKNIVRLLKKSIVLMKERQEESFA